MQDAHHTSARYGREAPFDDDGPGNSNFAGRQRATTSTSGLPYPLTLANLARHTVLNPPDAKDTVATYLSRLVLPQQEGCSDDLQTRQTGNTGTKAASREVGVIPLVEQPKKRDAQKSDPVDFRQQWEIVKAQAQAQAFVEILPSETSPEAAALPPENNLVKSMKSRKDPPASYRKSKAPFPTSISSSSSASRVWNSSCQGEAQGHTYRKQDHSPQPGTSKPGHLARRTSRKRQANSHSGEPTKSVKNGRGFEDHRSTRDNVANDPAHHIRPETSEERDRRELLEQRKERRRAKAVIVKDRTKVTGPSEVVVKINKKAREAHEGGRRKIRDLDDDHDDSVSNASLSKRRKKRKQSKRQHSSTSSQVPEDYTKLDITTDKKQKKKLTDVQRNIDALQQAAKRPRVGGKRKRMDPLERAANIIPAGRVTLKSKTGIYNHGRASQKQAVVGQQPRSRTFQNLAFNEMPFLNQDPVADSRAGLIRDSAMHAKDESALVEPKKQTYKSHRTEEAINANTSIKRARPEVSRDASSHSAHFTSERQESRPKSPKRRSNVEKLKSHHDVTATVPAQMSPPRPKILENLPSIRTIPSPPHKRQGLTLITRDAESATTPRQRQITDRTQSGSSHAASPNTQSRVLSTLTGLSAGSLARRRLLRKIARADERAAKEYVSPADLEEELRIFKKQHQSQGSQAFGPTAKYGSAKVPNANVRSAPEIPEVPPRQRPQSVHASSTARAFFQSPMQNQDRSPDWFADTGSPAYSILHRDNPSHTSPGHTVPRASTSRLGLGLTDAPFCDTMDRTDAATQSPHGRTPGNSRSIRGTGQAFRPYNSPRSVYVEQPLQYGRAEEWPTENDTRSYVDDWQYAPTLGDRISYLDERHQYQNARLPEPSTSTVSYPAGPPYRAPTPRPPTYIPGAAPFQQGRAGLYSYHDTSSPAYPSMQPPRGFWQRNAL